MMQRINSNMMACQHQPLQPPCRVSSGPPSCRRHTYRQSQPDGKQPLPPQSPGEQAVGSVSQAEVDALQKTLKTAAVEGLKRATTVSCELHILL